MLNGNLRNLDFLKLLIGIHVLVREYTGTCMGARLTKITGFRSDDWIY
jgi:hypothetical protein